MTAATATPSANAPTVTGANDSAAHTSGTTPDLRWVWIASEVLLIATSVAAVRLLGRLFEDTTYLLPMVFSVIVSHAVLIAMRWFGFNAIVSGLVSFVAVVLAIVATHYADTATAVLIPNGATLDQFEFDLQSARTVFDTMQTPVPAITGFVVFGSLAFWLLSFAADWAAFRLFTPGQALLPGLTVLIFVSLLGVENERVYTTAMLIVTGVLFLLAHRAATRAVQGIWLGDGPTSGYLALMIGGALVAGAAVAAGVLGGPSVPGADEAPLVEIGNEGRRENKPIEVISPLVQIQPRLVDQSDQILFSVETTQRAYWRIAALDVFDGQLWRSQGQFANTRSGLDVAYDRSVPVDVIQAAFDLGSLNVVWAPAPYLPTALQNLSEDVDINYEAESATFIVDTNDQRVSDGLRYVVQAEAAKLTPEMLQRLPDQNPGAIDPRYLALPADYSPLARAEAERITAGLPTAYDQAMALQNYFRDNFTYDIDVAKGHDIERLEDFLTVQRGYCEQFAGTFASMARAIGLPARVATGFTPGDQDPSNPNRYVVRGRHAHAWPEVWIAGAGWVAFEPTPGRGAPNATSYTGVPESQDSGSPEEVQEQPQTQQAELSQEADALPIPPTPTPVPPEPAPAEAVQPQPEEQPDLNDPLEVPSGGIPTALIVVALIALATLAWIVAVPALKRWKSARRRTRLGDDHRRLITLSWATLTDRLERLGHPPETNETLTEYCDRLERQLPLLAPAFGELTALAVAASYDDRPPTADQAARAAALAESVESVLEADQPFLVRGAWDIDPRPLLQLNDRVAARADRLAAGATTLVAPSPSRGANPGIVEDPDSQTS